MKIGLLQRLPLPSAGDEIGWTNTNPTTDAKTIGVMETLDGLGHITTGFSFLVMAMVVFARAAGSSVNAN